MPYEAWTPVLETVSRARGFWISARDVALPEERPLWRAPDELFSVLVLRLEALADSRSSVPDAVPAGTANLLRVCEELVRLPVDGRSPLLENIYRSLRNVLARADPPSKQDGAQTEAARTTDAAGLRHEDLEPFASDAAAQARLMWAYYLAAALLVMVVIAGLAWLLLSDSASEESPLVPLVGLGALVVLAGAAGQQARECRRAAFETRRIYRQLMIVDKYLQPMPQGGRDLMRGVMMQRLFPRLLDDENPMREDEIFPDPDKLLIALDPQYADMRLGDETERPPATGASTPAPASVQPASDSPLQQPAPTSQSARAEPPSTSASGA